MLAAQNYGKSSALAPVFNNEVVQSCCTSPFTILCDSGSDQTYRKYLEAW